MIKANELRIGNWVYYPLMKNNYKLIRIDIDNKNENNYEPIPLTEDILVKCGFKKNVGHYIIFGRYKDKTLEVAYNNDTNENQYYVYVRGLLDNEFVQLRHDLKCLHTLQNLIFALTGEELNINL